MRKLISLGVAAALAFAAASVSAQPSSSTQAITPLTRDIGTVRTLTAQSAATVVSSDQNGYNVSRVTCVFNQSTYSGSPSTTFKIQNKDAASGLYYDLVQSAAVTTALSTPSAIAAGGGVTVVTNVSTSFPLAQRWRVSVTVGGSATPLVTGTVGCSVQ